MGVVKCGLCDLAILSEHETILRKGFSCTLLFNDKDYN